jgi:hypothetical protein
MDAERTLCARNVFVERTLGALCGCAGARARRNLRLPWGARWAQVICVRGVRWAPLWATLRLSAQAGRTLGAPWAHLERTLQSSPIVRRIMGAHWAHLGRTLGARCAHVVHACSLARPRLAPRGGARWAQLGRTLGAPCARGKSARGARWAHVGHMLGARWAHVGRTLDARCAYTIALNNLQSAHGVFRGKSVSSAEAEACVGRLCARLAPTLGSELSSNAGAPAEMSSVQKLCSGKA